MVLCPDCRNPVASLEISACPTCDWRPQQIASVPVFLSSADRERELFSRYVANYDQIATDDLEETIQSQPFLEFQAERLHRYLGDLEGRRICDVGMGHGFLFERLRASKPALLTGVDISVAYLAGQQAGDGVRTCWPTPRTCRFATYSASTVPVTEFFAGPSMSDGSPPLGAPSPRMLRSTCSTSATC